MGVLQVHAYGAPTPTPTHAGLLRREMNTRLVEYRVAGTRHVGYLATPTVQGGRVPVVLVAHTWAGRDSFAEAVARRFAERGFVGFALDNYGEGRLGATPDENRSLMQPLMADRALLHRTMLAGMTAAASEPEVDGARVAVVGFCFGGLAALDLARVCPDLRASVSFHGLLTPAESCVQLSRIQARVLVLHGWDDPLVRPPSVEAFATEMAGKGADWQVLALGGTVHGFTNPANNSPERGVVYNARSSERAWTACDGLLAETLGSGMA